MGKEGREDIGSQVAGMPKIGGEFSWLPNSNCGSVRHFSSAVNHFLLANPAASSSRAKGTTAVVHWLAGGCGAVVCGSFASPMAMNTSPGCAFSLPPCAAIARVLGDHRVLPRDTTPGRSRSTNPPHVLHAINEREWQTLAYRPGRRLADRRTRRRETRQSLKSVGGSDPAEYGGGDASSGQMQQQQRQQGEERVVPPPPATDLSSIIAGEHEDAVIRDDPFEELEDDRRRHPCVVHDTLAAGPTPYNDGWEWQKQTLARLAERPNDLSSTGAEPDRVLLTQHDAVFTLGTGSTLDHLRFDPDDAPFGEVVRTERGGEVTYHGPGQIVMYPIMNLRRYRQDIHWYLRALEETVIRTLAKLGLKGERVEGLTGVWVDGHKVAAVGVRVKRWITMHGLSLNVRPDLEHFKHITPCGISDRPVGSLELLCAEGEDASIVRVGRLLLESFEEVFGVSTVPAAANTPPSAPP